MFCESRNYGNRKTLRSCQGRGVQRMDRQSPGDLKGSETTVQGTVAMSMFTDLSMEFTTSSMNSG